VEKTAVNGRFPQSPTKEKAMLKRFQQFLTPPRFPDDEDKTRAATLLNLIYLALIPLMLLNTLRALIFDFEILAFLINGLAALISIGLFVLLQRGHVRASGLVMVSLFWVIITATSIWVTSLSLPIISSYFVLVFLAGVVVSRRAATTFTIITLVAVSLIYFLYDSGTLPPVAPGSLLADVSSTLFNLIVLVVALNLTLKTLDQVRDEMRQTQQALEQNQAMLEEQVAEQTRDLNLAVQGARNLSQIRDVDLLLIRSVEVAQSTFDLYYVQLYLVDEAAQRLTLRAGTGLVGRRLLSQGHFLPLDNRTVNGTAVLEKRSVIIADTRQDTLFYPNTLLPDTRAEAALPLLLGDRALGVLNAQSAQPGAFTRQNLLALEALAGQLAIALDNAQLIAAQQETAVSLQSALAQTEQQAHRLARLNDMATALDAATEINDLLAVIAQHAGDLFPDSRATVALIDDESQTFDWFDLDSETGVMPQKSGQPLAETAVALATRQNQIVHLPDDHPFDHLADARHLAEGGAQSSLIAPLIADGAAIGAFIIATPNPLGCTPTDTDLLRQVANQLSASLESRRLNERLSRLAAIVENNQDLVAISDLAGRVSYINAAGLQMLQLSPDTDIATLNLTDFLPEQDADELLEIGLPAALQSGLWSDEAHLKTASGGVIPVRQTIAVHYDAEWQPDSFFVTLRDISESKQIEAAQQNLTAQLEERLTQLNALQRAMTREGWSAFMTAPERLVQGYAYEDGRLRLISRRDLSGDKLPTLTQSTQPEEATSDASSLAIPITVRGETVGVLGLRAPDGAPLNQAQRSMTQTIIQQLADALERARLFEEIELARSQTDALYVGSEHVIRARSLDEVLQALVDHTSLKQFERVDMVFFDTAWDTTPPNVLNVAATWDKTRPVSGSEERRTFKLSQFPFITRKQRSTPFVCEDVLTDGRLDERTRTYITRVQGTRSFLLFPLVSGERWIGFVLGQSTTVQRLTEQNIRQIGSLVSQAATVSQTQRLFTEAQQRARREQVLREIANRVYAAADAESILRTAAREINQTLGLETFIYLQDVDEGKTAVTNGHDQTATTPEAAT
jgi:PAS domain S-box-containing protein